MINLIINFKMILKLKTSQFKVLLIFLIFSFHDLSAHNFFYNWILIQSQALPWRIDPNNEATCFSE